MEPHDSASQQIQLLADLMHTFLDWRHKVLTRFALVVGAIWIAVARLHDGDWPRGALVMTLLVGSVASVSALFMDRANQLVLFASYQSGCGLEDATRQRGVFHTMFDLFGVGKTHSGCTLDAPTTPEVVATASVALAAERSTSPSPDAESGVNVDSAGDTKIEQQPAASPWRYANPRHWWTRAKYRTVLVGLYVGSAVAFAALAILVASGPSEGDAAFVANPCDTSATAREVVANRATAGRSVEVPSRSTVRLPLDPDARAVVVVIDGVVVAEVAPDLIEGGTYVIHAAACR